MDVDVSTTLDRPPYALRGALLTPLADGGTRYLDDALMTVDERGRISRVIAFAPADEAAGTCVDLRPLVVMPGLIDLHSHLPQGPTPGWGPGWTYSRGSSVTSSPSSAASTPTAARRLAPLFYRALAAAGTTTAVLYGAVFEDSVDASFAAAEEHGVRPCWAR